MTKKTLTVRPLGEREAPELQKRPGISLVGSVA